MILHWRRLKNNETPGQKFCDEKKEKIYQENFLLLKFKPTFVVKLAAGQVNHDENQEDHHSNHNDDRQQGQGTQAEG